jgi:DNA invertase Pin-like site-specific DNA recombinase
MNQNFRVFSFQRWSTGAQGSPDRDSSDRQDDGAIAYCAERGWTLDERLIDPGRSAYKGQHMQPGGSLWRFFDMTRRGDIKPGDVLLFEGWDRFTRQPVDISIPLFLELIRAGITVITTFDRVEYTKATIRNNSGLLHSSLAAMDAAYRNSYDKGKRVRSAWKKRRDHKTLVCPAWMRPKVDKTGFDLLPACVAVIERIYHLAIAGNGVKTICRTLNGEGVPGFQRHYREGTKPKRKESKGWHHSYVLTLLTDRRVIGEAEFFEWHTDDDGVTTRKTTGERRKIYPAAISEELFVAAQEVRRRPHQGRNGEAMTNLFGAGIARCVCGTRMKYINKGKKGSYLQCVDAMRGQDCEHRKLHRYELVERFVLLLFGTLAYGEIGQDEATSAIMVEKARAQREADDIEAQYNRILDAIGTGQSTLAAKRLATLEDRHKAVVKRLQSIERQLAELSVRPLGERLGEVQKLIANMDQLDGEERVAVRSRINRGLAGFIDRVVFNDPNPPAHAVRPADYVQATEWYIRFRQGWPPHLPTQSTQAKTLIAMMGKTTIRNSEVTIEIPGR